MALRWQSTSAPFQAPTPGCGDFCISAGMQQSPAHRDMSAPRPEEKRPGLRFERGRHVRIAHMGSMPAEDAVTERESRNHDEQKLRSDSM
jgi:hypothetical protein